MKDFTMTLLVDQTPEEVYDAVNNVRGWWSEAIEGGTDQLHDEFIYRYKDVHYSKQELIEMIPAKKVTWLVIDSSLNFIKDKKEWNGTRISFEISRQGDQTELRFTHHGLTPDVECYDACFGGWTHYLNKSLLPLITTGKGAPNKVEEIFEAEGKK
jgi:hypothetical protein